MNLRPLISRLQIQTKAMDVVDFPLNWAQDIYLDEVHRQAAANKPIRIIVLKARQLGISTITEACIFCFAFLWEGMSGLVVAHELPASNHLLGITDLYWQTFFAKDLYKTKFASKNHLRWENTRSNIQTVTAKNATAGRSRTIHALHASEFAFWFDAKTTMSGLTKTIPTTPNSFVCIESTANGVGNMFYDQWNMAMVGDTDYVPLFFPWWVHPEYRASHINIPPYELGPLDEEEKQLIALWTRGLTVGNQHYEIPASTFEDALAWRRWCIKNECGGDVNEFHQEYPATPEEAFLSTGTNVFPLKKLRAVYQEKQPQVGRLVRDGNGVRFAPDSEGPLKVYRRPSRDLEHGVYFIGGDPTHTTEGDPAVAQVINRRTYEQVATLRLRTDPMSFADELINLGMYYNEAMISTEIEGPGYATIGRIMSENYPHVWRHRWADKTPGKIAESYGWSTTWKRKNQAIGWLLKLVVDGDIVIHDFQTYMEMKDYVRLEGAEYGPASPDGYDDCVMSMAICAICSSMEAPVAPYSGEMPGRPGADEPEEPSWTQWEVDSHAHV